MLYVSLANFVVCCVPPYRAQVRRNIMQGLINKMRNILRDPSLPSRGLASGTAKKASSKRHIPGGLLPGHGRMRSGHQSPAGSLTSLCKHPTPAILVFLAVLALGLLFLMPGGLLHAQNDGMIEYAEDRTDAVATFTATDPEDRMVYWSLLATNATGTPDDITPSDDSAEVGHFSISANGVLSFNFPPDYEAAPTTNNAAPNTYRVVVVAADEPLGAANRVLGYKKVTVMVTDEDEPGMVTLSAQKPQIGVPLMATLTDDDATPEQISAAEWMWEHSSAANGPWTPILTATTAAYTPLGVADKYLRVTATYNDGHGSDKSSVPVVSANMVRAVPDAANANPIFPTTGSNARSVDENSPPGTMVGARVAANDAAGDTLTYTLGTSGDNVNYRIDQATGQITVGPRTTLNHETNASDEVTVTATDPAGGTIDETVTITINDVNEAPMITEGFTRNSQAEDDAGETTDDADVKTVDTYVATDVDQDTAVSWSVSGTDAGDFNISNAAGTVGALTFKEAPNYEMPADSNGDNVYMVTVVASDAGVDSKNKMTAERAVVITITNVDENGTVTLSSEQPKIGIELTAMLEDPDGVVADSVKWTWHSSNDGTGDAIEMATSATYTPEAIGDLSAKASYTDGHGANKEAVGSATNAVEVNLANVAPKFPDTETGMREVAENTIAGMGIGTPVTAMDDNVADTVLTYTLSGTDMASFDIDRSDGQLQTKAKLDYEDKNSYMVTVTATDPDGASASIDVTIMVTNEDEPPMIAGDDITEDFRENGSNLEIERFTADDPEDRMVYWSLADENVSGVDGIGPDDENDHAEFSISDDGVLSFKFSPDYEMPRGRAISESNTNTYRVVVVAADNPTGAGTTGMPIMMGHKKVTVNVTNVDETETITLSAERAQVGVALTATYNDLDNELSTATLMWKWYLGGSEIPDPDDDKFTASGSTASYDAPESAGSLRVEASHIRTDGTTKTVSKTISVRAEPDLTNAAPTFPTGAGARSVDENSPPGTKVGARVTANDASGDTLAYTLGTSGDNVNYRIDQATGQITVGPRTTLNHEDNASDEVTVTATDPWGGTIDETVTITINDVNEAPMITEGFTRNSQAEDDAGETTDDADVKTVDTYVATDVDQDTAVSWSVSGTDAGDFNISNAAGTVGALTFKEAPNYEMPADSNGDNVYMVTVVASDAGVDSKNKMTAERAVVITITNVDENGTVTLSSEQPKIGIELTAMLEDPDGVVADSVKWTWHSSNDGTGDAIEMATSATYTPEAIGDLSAKASYTDGHGANKEAIKEAANTVVVNTANVAPKFPDTETGMREVAEGTAAGTAINDAADDNDADPVEATDDNTGDTLTYTLSGTDMASFDIVRSSGQLQTKAKLDYEDKKSYMVTVTATDPSGLSASVDVTIKVTDMDEAPMIERGGLAISGMSSGDYAENRMDAVAEYTLAGPMKDRARWALEGDDASDFTLMNGTLNFKRTPNYEMPMDSDTDNVYMVTVKAMDGTYTAMKPVTVTVTNVDEIGTLSGPETVSNYMEDSEDTVGTYRVSGGSMSEMANLTLMGDDAGDFRIMDDGMLKFRSSPDFENPMDSDTDNEYMVTVKAEAGGEMAMRPVTVTVINEEEPGRVTLWDGTVALTMAPQVGDTITGAVMDPDGGETGESWQWSRTMTPDMMDSWMDIQDATAAAYTVTAGDEGYYLRVMATYTDAVGTDMAMEYSPATMMVEAESEMMGEVTLWAGADALTMAPQVGDTITGAVMDPDGGETVESWQWSRTMTPDMMDSWMDIQDATAAAYTVTAGDEGYYLRVMATYTDAVGTDMAMEYSPATMMVEAESEMMGEVTLWAGADALTMAPQVGDTITGAVMDPDGGETGETWQWSRTMTPDMMDSWMDIEDATEAAYMVTADDTGYHLRVMATYMDAVGTDMDMAYSPATMMVAMAEEMTLLGRYDTTPQDGSIQLEEARVAVGDYFVEPKGSVLSLEDAREVVGLYFEYKNSQSQ